MRADEFITEGGPPRGKMNKEHENASATGGSTIARDTGGYDRVYHMNRLAMAMAMSDGKTTKAVKMDVASPVEKFNSYHPFTDEEHNMIQSALKTIPSEHHKMAKRGKSSEPDDTHKTSPMMGFSGYGAKPKKAGPIKKK
jgi:hypothetical protein